MHDSAGRSSLAAFYELDNARHVAIFNYREIEQFAGELARQQ